MYSIYLLMPRMLSVAKVPLASTCFRKRGIVDVIILAMVIMVLVGASPFHMLSRLKLFKKVK